jgi:aspartate dehydrogenase
MNDQSDQPLRVAIAGLGAIGLAVARHLDRGGVPGLALSAVASGNREKAEKNLADFKTPPPVVSLAELADQADVIVECAPAAFFDQIARPALERGRTLVALSVGALLDREELVDLARKTGGRIIVPTGALLGLDAVKAAAKGHIEEVSLVTRKPPAGLKGAPHLIDNNISVDGLREAKLVFAGSAYDAAKGFPANLNIGAALALAGKGPGHTSFEIWADPSIDRNTHTITVRSDSSNFTMTIENTPVPESPRTGKITALSTIAALERLVSPLTIGT